MWHARRSILLTVAVLVLSASPAQAQRTTTVEHTRPDVAETPEHRYSDVHVVRSGSTTVVVRSTGRCDRLDLRSGQPPLAVCSTPVTVSTPAIGERVDAVAGVGAGVLAASATSRGPPAPTVSTSV